MRLVFVILFFCIVFVSAAPQSKLQFGNEENKQVVEEVVVESVLHIKSQSGNRQARTDARTNLKDGARVAETRIY